MFLKKYDSKNFYPIFWAFIAVLAITLPYYVKLISTQEEHEPIIVIIVALIAGTTVYFKSKIDLFRYKNIYRTLVKHNVEMLINSSISICTEKHGKKNENFYCEFLEVDTKYKKLRSRIRSNNFNKKIDELKEEGKHFDFDLNINKGFAGITYIRTLEISKKIENYKSWENFMLSSKSLFPILIKSDEHMANILGFEKEEMLYICNSLKIKSVFLCPVAIFKKRWYRKGEKISVLGILLYTSNLKLPDETEDYNYLIHSSLVIYRKEVLKQSFTIAKYPKIFEKAGRRIREE